MCRKATGCRSSRNRTFVQIQRTDSSAAFAGRFRPNWRGLGVVPKKVVHPGPAVRLRAAYAEVVPDEKATTVAGVLKRAVAFYALHGITVQQLLTTTPSRAATSEPTFSVPTTRRL